MLKTFMQTSNTSNTKIDSTRPSHSGYPPKPAESSKPVEATQAEASAVTNKSTSSDEGSKLIVGPNIKLKGSEITDCEILVVEGRVEASMNSRDIRIAEGGVFSGKAEIDVAEVRGTFEGELTARKRLVVYATGRVKGTIRYGALMVEEGGVISGNMAMHSAGPSLSKVSDSSAQTAAAEATEEKAPELEQIHSGATFSRSQAGRRQG
jgi:cytoskeletal protein CcmA (bactofilin family)